jgi:hypothetical protein
VACNHEPLMEIEPCDAKPEGVPVSVGMMLPQRVCRRCGCVYVEGHVRRKIAEAAKRPARDKHVQRRRYVDEGVLAKGITAIAAMAKVDQALRRANPDAKGVVENIRTRMVREGHAAVRVSNADPPAIVAEFTCDDCRITFGTADALWSHACVIEGGDDDAT